MTLRSRLSGKCLQVDQAGQAEQLACSGSDVQQWTLTQAGTGFVLGNRRTGLVLGVGGARVDGWRVLAQHTPVAGARSQTWTFVPVP